MQVDGLQCTNSYFPHNQKIALNCNPLDEMQKVSKLHSRCRYYNKYIRT